MTQTRRRFPESFKREAVDQVSCELHCFMQDSRDLHDLILSEAVEHDVPGPYYSALGILRSVEEQMQAS
ncbi:MULTISPECIES: hypothetical protein [unclassified Pseudomonas]|uniref:hypothetical protein n=1 Tax=unclassified Pseudomonas TaxID=196821 RepID=UPI0013025A14|nr:MULTISPECIES: hypothetical protein [unclassified Pseudomonas]